MLSLLPSQQAGSYRPLPSPFFQILRCYLRVSARVCLPEEIFHLKRSVAKKRAQEVPILWSLKSLNLGWKNKENIILWRFLHPHNNIPHLPISPTCIQIFFQEILHSRESLSFLIWRWKRRCHCEGKSFWVRLDCCCCCVFFLQEEDGDGDDDANGCCELHRTVSVQIGWCIRASTCQNWFQSPGMLACLLPSLRIFGIPLFLRVFLDARCEGELEKKSLSSKSALHGTCSKTLKSFCQDHPRITLWWILAELPLEQSREEYQEAIMY